MIKEDEMTEHEESIKHKEEPETLVELAHEVRDEVITYKETSLQTEDTSIVSGDDKPVSIITPVEEKSEEPVIIKSEESSDMFSGIVRIAVKSPVESYRIKCWAMN